MILARKGFISRLYSQQTREKTMGIFGLRCAIAQSHNLVKESYSLTNKWCERLGDYDMFTDMEFFPMLYLVQNWLSYEYPHSECIRVSNIKAYWTMPRRKQTVYRCPKSI